MTIEKIIFNKIFYELLLNYFYFVLNKRVIKGYYSLLKNKYVLKTTAKILKKFTNFKEIYIRLTRKFCFLYRILK